MLTQNHGLSTLSSRNHAWRGRIVRLTAVLFSLGSLLSQAHAAETFQLRPERHSRLSSQTFVQTDDYYISSMSVVSSPEFGYVTITGKVEAEPYVNLTELTVFINGCVNGDALVNSDGSFQTVIVGYSEGTGVAEVGDYFGNHSAPHAFFVH